MNIFITPAHICMSERPAFDIAFGVFSVVEQQLPAETSIVPLNNFGANYLRLSVCSKDIDTTKLLRFGQVGLQEIFRAFFVQNHPLQPLSSIAIRES